MSTIVASLKAVLDLDKRGFDSGLKGAAGGLKGFRDQAGGALDTLGKIGGVVAGFAVVGAAIGGMVDAAREAIAVNKDLEATILSTGGVAGVTGDMARKYAEDLSMVTNFQDDAILSGEAMLLTFTRIGADVFPLATEAMLNMAQKFGSIDAAAISLGKALNDPIKGVTALGRQGIQFSATQKQQIKDFMAVNDIAGAQGIILGELGTQFGGLAKAAADPFIQVQNAIGEVQEMLGMALMPMLLEIANAVLPALREAAAGTGAGLGEFGIALGKLEGGVLVDIIGMVVQLAGQLKTFVTGVRDLGVALGLGGNAIELFKLGLLPLRITFGLIGGAASILGVTFTILGNIIKVIAFAWSNMARAIDQATGISAAIMPVWNALSAAGTTLSQIIQIIGMAWANLIRVMSQPFTPPPLLDPGSPTPMEMGLRGIADAITTMPPLKLGDTLGNQDIFSGIMGGFSKAKKAIAKPEHFGDNTLQGFINMVKHDTPGALEAFDRLIQSGASFKQASKGWASEAIPQLRQYYNQLGKSINIPSALTPGSPTPFEMGIRGITSAIKSIPALPSLGGTGMGGMVPMAAGGGGASNINITIGNVSASTTTNGDAASEAIRLTMQMLRQQLDR